MFVLCKVTILALHLGYGGVEKAISSLSNILIDKYDVEIISVYKLYDKPAFYIDDRVKIKYLLDTELSPNKKELKDAIRTKNPIKILSEGLKSVKILKLKSSKMIDAIKNIDSGIVISTRIEHNKLLSKYGNKNLITIAQEHTYHNENEKYIKDLVESCKNIDYFMPVSQMLTDFYKKYFEGTKTNCVFIPHSLDYIPREVSALESKKINYMIIDPRNNYRIDEKSDNRNLNEYEEQAKKAYTIVKQKRKVEKIKNDLETYIGKENFRSISSKMEEILNENRKI